MPRLDALAWTVWAAVIAAQTVILVIMLRKKQWRRWPAVFTFIALRCCVSYILLAIVLLLPRHSAAAPYFYVYWAAAGATCVIRIWMIVELGGAACYAARSIQLLLARIIPAIAVLFFGVSALLAVGAPVQYEQVLAQMTIGFGRTIALTWLATFLVVAYACEFFGIKWGESDRKLALGLSLQAISATAISWLIGMVSQDFSTLISDVQDAVYFLSLLLWTDALLRDREIGDGIFSLDQLRDISGDIFRIGKGHGGA